MTQAREQSTDKEWISVHEASALIGVSPATLRRWSDAGEIRTFTTPGGHRRFARSAILGLLPAGRNERPSLERLGETPVHMIRVYRRHLAETCLGLLWVQELDEPDRREFRLLGRRIAGALLDAIDAVTPEAQAPALDEATKVAAEFGRLAALCRVDAQQTVEAFLRFRLPFLRELADVARRRGLDIREATDLLETAIETIDRLLGALLAGHGAPAPVPARLGGEPS